MVAGSVRICGQRFSGLAVEAFCERAGISDTSLSRLRSRLGTSEEGQDAMDHSPSESFMGVPVACEACCGIGVQFAVEYATGRLGQIAADAAELPVTN